MSQPKIIPFGEAPAFFEKLRAEGKVLVHCHGTFDLVHPGHIYHLEEARELGDLLVVTLTGEKFVNKGPGRPYFNDKLRAKSLTALACVDYVVVIPHATAVEAIECVRPQIYCKGREYEKPENDVTGNIHDDLKAVARCGGRVRYVGSVVFSSTKLLNNHLDHLPIATKEFCKELAGIFPPSKFRETVDGLQDLKVLLIGDIIFDRYSYVRVQGLTSKATIVSARHLSQETQPGGALAVYRHLRQFTPHVRLVSLLGTEEWAQQEVAGYVEKENDGIVRDPDFTSIVKHRFVAPFSEERELTKYFSVNYINEKAPSPETIQRLQEVLCEEIKKADLVIVTDFGHYLMHPSLRDLVQAKAKFLAVNCQTNSNNHGFNIINRQYRRADCFSLDETEILLAVGQRHIDYVAELEKLRAQFYSHYAWLTRGGIETIGLSQGEKPCICQPFAIEVVDTVGAGDAFFAVASLVAAKGHPNSLATFMGQLAGAQAVRITGNSRPVMKSSLLKTGMILLNY